MAGPRALRQLLDAVLTIGSDLDLPAVLRRIVEAATQLVDAQYGALGVLDETGTRLSQFITVGVDDATHKLIGHLPSGHGILGLLIVDARPIRLPDLKEHPDSYGFPPNHPPMTSFLGVPIRLRDEVFGNLYLTDKRSAEVFSDIDEELAVGLAAAASIAIDNARLHGRLQQMGIVEDRERIARDLHDTVIQRLFATGLSLQGTMPLIKRDPEYAARRVAAAIDELDITVKHIRSAIFTLEASPGPVVDGLRKAVLDVIKEASEPLGFDPRVVFEGPVDTALDDELGADLLASLREALSNVARHAQAGSVAITLSVGADVCLQVADDGVGPPGAETPRGNGLDNLAARARRRGGDMTLTAAAPSGTLLEWRAPRPDAGT